MARRKVAPLIIILISLVLVSSFLVPPYSSPPVTSTPLSVKPQAHFAVPSNQSGNGDQMNLVQSVNAWRANTTMKANNTFSSYQQRNAQPFTESTPTSYSKVWQNLTISNLTATQDVREVQYAASSLDSLIANETGIGTYAQVAMRFRSVDKANFTGIWMYYSSAGVANLNIVNSSTNSGDKTPSGRPTIATYTLPTALEGWHWVKFGTEVTLRAGFYYWVVVNATGMGKTLTRWFYIADSGGVEDNKCASVYSGGWLTEANLVGGGKPYLNLMLMLDVLPVRDTDASKARTYPSPLQVVMNETNSNTQLLSNTTRIPVGYSTFVLRANTSVTFAMNWTARFEYSQTNAVSTYYIAKNGFTLWNASFTPLDKPTDPYTWYNLTFRVTTVPQFWTVPSPSTNITSTPNGYSFDFLSGAGYYFIRQTNNINNSAWNDNWLVRSNSTYRVSASLPFQVVAGLPLALNVSTKPYSPSWCNVSFYNTLYAPVYSRNISIPLFSALVTLKLNETGVHTLSLFDRWTGGNEASFNKTLTINVRSPLCNVTITDRTSPVIGNIGSFKFKFYNNSLGTGNTRIQPQAVSVNGTLTTNFVYDPPSGNTTVYVNTASGGWRTGSNTIIVSAQSGVFNATLENWIIVLQPSCNITVVDRTSAVIGNNVELKFKFYNNSLGSGVPMQPSEVSINGTLTSFTNGPSGNTSVILSTTSAAWHVGNNTLVVSAERGVFNATLTTWIWIQMPLADVSIIGPTQPLPGINMTMSFRFVNNTPGATPLYINPVHVYINGTSTSFTFSGGVVTTTWSILSGGWHLGLNHVNVSAMRGVFTGFTVTVINILSPLCNESVVSTSQPLPGIDMSIDFRFFNKTAGVTPLTPDSVRINGTSAYFTYSGGVVTTTWSILSGGWHLGLNHVNVSATSGVFSNFTVIVINILSPLCNASDTGTNQPILGNPATATFRFLNGTNGWAAMSPLTVLINGTSTPFTYVGGVTTVSWGTALGGWQSGLNYVNITAVNGVFRNFTIVPVDIIQPTAKLILDATSYSATYGDLRQISFMFLNTTLGSSSPLPVSALYLNGSAVVYVHWTGAWYNYTLDTAARFNAAKNWHLSFTAVYGEYAAANLTSVAVGLIPMQLSVSSGQTSVNVDSSYSVKANLTYTSGAPAPDGCIIRFVFSVTYANGSTLPIVAYGTTTDGMAEASLLATSGMQSVVVEAFYDGSLTLDTANGTAASIRVTVATGLSIPVLLGIGVGGALVVIIPLAVIVKRRRSRETETRKTSVLRQTASLAQLIVVHLASGRSLFSRTIGSEEGADPNLISGFLSANQTLISEVFKKQSGAGLKFADYGDYKVISDLGKHVMVTLFATETAGKELKDVLQSFTGKFENKYAKALESWDGDMNTFKDADALADEVFCLPLTAPYMLLETTSAKLGKVERMAVHSAKIISAERGVFFMPRVIDYLLTKQGIRRGKAMDAINSLTNKGIFRQLTVEQAAQVIKSCAEKADTKQ